METSPLQTPGLIRREALTDAQRAEMFALLSRYFEGVTRGQFESDLNEKNWVVDVRGAGRLLGFSTLQVGEAHTEAGAVTAIYSGDTIVSPEGWTSPALARTWIRAVNHLRAASPGRPCYWLLLTSGFRTYRFLPVFWREFYPRHDAPTPAQAQRLLDQLASLRYGACYDAASGIVRFPRPQRLQGTLGAVPAGRRADPHVACFLARNPGHARGDELACLAEISDANLSRAGRRIVSSLES